MPPLAREEGLDYDRGRLGRLDGQAVGLDRGAGAFLVALSLLARSLQQVRF